MMIEKTLFYCTISIVWITALFLAPNFESIKFMFYKSQSNKPSSGSYTLKYTEIDSHQFFRKKFLLDTKLELQVSFLDSIKNV